MLRIVRRESRTAADTSVSRDFISTTSAASMATSAPAPIAMPRSARVRAGASLMPSPTMATRPCFWSCRITASLPSGRTPATTRSTPASAPMAFAVRSLSPVSITTCRPMLCSSRTASAESALIGSATAITPSSAPSRAKNSGVRPASASFSASCRSAAGSSVCPSMNVPEPPSRRAPSSMASTPLPGSARNPSTGGGAIPSACARRRIALASGCSEYCSSAAAKRSSSAFPIPSAGNRSVTSGSPAVMVPVLSSATMSSLPASSWETAVLKRMPFFAPMPLPTMIATGVASPSAQGQEITSTAMARAIEKVKLFPPSSQTPSVSSATPITAGTNTAETRSAIRARGALVAAASLTMRMI